MIGQTNTNVTEEFTCETAANSAAQKPVPKTDMKKAGKVSILSTIESPGTEHTNTSERMKEKETAWKKRFKELRSMECGARRRNA